MDSSDSKTKRTSLTPVVSKYSSQTQKQEILPTKHVRPKKHTTRNPIVTSPPRDLSAKSKWKSVVFSGPSDLSIDDSDVDKRVAKKRSEENIETADEHTLDMLEMSLSGSLTSELGEFNDIPELRHMAEENRRERMREGYSLERQIDEAIRRAEERERQELEAKEKEAQLAFEEVVRRYGTSPAVSAQSKATGPVAISLDTVPTIPLSRPQMEEKKENTKEDTTEQKSSHQDSKESSHPSSKISSRKSSQLQSPQVQFSQQASPEKNTSKETKQAESQPSSALLDSQPNIQISEPQPDQPLQSQSSDQQASQPLNPLESSRELPPQQTSEAARGATKSKEPCLLFDLVDSDEVDSLMEPLSISSNVPVSGPVTPLMATPLNGLASQLLGNPSSATRRAASALFSHPLPPEALSTRRLSVDLPVPVEESGISNTEHPSKRIKAGSPCGSSNIIMVNCNVEIKAIHNCGSDKIMKGIREDSLEGMKEDSLVDRLQRCRKKIANGDFTPQQINEIEKKVDLILRMLMQDLNPGNGSSSI